MHCLKFAKAKTVDLVTVSLDVLPERCSLTMFSKMRAGGRFLPEHAKFSDSWPLRQVGKERNVGPKTICARSLSYGLAAWSAQLILRSNGILMTKWNTSLFYMVHTSKGIGTK